MAVKGNRLGEEEVISFLEELELLCNQFELVIGNPLDDDGDLVVRRIHQPIEYVMQLPDSGEGNPFEEETHPEEVIFLANEVTPFDDVLVDL